MARITASGCDQTVRLSAWTVKFRFLTGSKRLLPWLVRATTENPRVYMKQRAASRPRQTKD